MRISLILLLVLPLVLTAPAPTATNAPAPTATQQTPQQNNNQPGSLTASPLYDHTSATSATGVTVVPHKPVVGVAKTVKNHIKNNPTITVSKTTSCCMIKFVRGQPKKSKQCKCVKSSSRRRRRRRSRKRSSVKKSVKKLKTKFFKPKIEKKRRKKAKKAAKKLSKKLKKSSTKVKQCTCNKKRIIRKALKKEAKCSCSATKRKRKRKNKLPSVPKLSKK